MAQVYAESVRRADVHRAFESAGLCALDVRAWGAEREDMIDRARSSPTCMATATIAYSST